MEFQNNYCSGKIIEHNNSKRKDITIIGKLLEPVLENEIYYIAGSPPDFRTTYTGSALPFANENQAFDNTPNKGKVNIQNGIFKITIMYPNSYMVGLGTVTVPPYIHLQYKLLNGELRNITVKISDGIPYRSLTYSTIGCPRKDATFYSNHHCLPVRTQEQVLRDSGFPSVNKMPSNFWGLKPSM